MYRILLICLITSSCASVYTSKYKESNKFVKEDLWIKYFNDSIKSSILFFGDYKYTDNGVDLNTYYNSIDSKTLKQNSELIKKAYPELAIKIKKENFVFKASTFISPYISTSFFRYTNYSKTCSDTLIHDSINNVALSTVCDNGSLNIHIIYKDDRSTYDFYLRNLKKFSVNLISEKITTNH